MDVPKLNTKVIEYAFQYQIVLKPDAELGFIGTALEMPGVFSHGQTADACVAATREALEEAIEAMVREGLRVPKPSTSERREEQLNIRLNRSEKKLLETASTEQGYRTVSDFVRTAALSAATGAEMRC